MAVDPAKLKAARELIRDVLTKKVTTATNPALVQDDLLTFHVAIVEQGDAAWLEQQLRDARLDKDLRLQVALQLRGPLRKPLLTALGAPPFLLG